MPGKTFHLVLIPIFLLGICQPVSCGFAQKNDSSGIYSRIKKFTGKHKVTKWAYRLIFSDVKSKPANVISNPNHETMLMPYHCRIVRSITISVFDPFQQESEKITENKTKHVTNAINKWHVTTRKWVIANQLLFKINEELDVFNVQETERLLRQREFIQDANINVRTSDSTDSVDVDVVVFDRWSIILPLTVYNTQHASVSYIDKNLLGTGQRLEYQLGYHSKDGYQYRSSYSVNNLDHTFINGQIFYSSSRSTSSCGASFERPLLSPILHWAGGAGITSYWFNNTDSAVSNNTKTSVIQNEWWLAKSFALIQPNQKNSKGINLILASRFTNADWKKRNNIPGNGLFQEEHSSILFTAGIAIQHFFKTRLLYRFGTQEDIPLGLRAQITGGRIIREFSKNENYCATEFAGAAKTKLVYFAARFVNAIYLDKNKLSSRFSRADLFLFSNLIPIKNWKVRLFGFARYEYSELYGAGNKLRFENGDLYGMNGNTSTGTQKTLLNAESVFYAPFNLIGFKFGFIVMIGLGKLADSFAKLMPSKLFSAFGSGILFRNEHLLNSTFQLTFGYYPVLPDGKKNIFLFNPVGTFTLRINSFSISKPMFLF